MREKVSVAMATYNGEKYIKEQIESILINLQKGDELIISDDGSIDNTIKIIKEYAKNDDRIKLISGPGKGVKQNFANAIKNTKGKYIFLSDQDDIWQKNKVEKVLKYLEKENCTLVVHDAEIFNDKDNTIISNSFFAYRKSGCGVIKNIYKNTYIGCCMAFDSKIIRDILPIPDNIEMHDQWIGIINDFKYSKSIFINDKLIRYRRHLNNTSKMQHYGFKKMIKNRIIFLNELLKFKKERKK